MIDMSNDVTLASLGAQVTSLDRDYQEVKRALIGLDAKLDSSLASFSTKMDASLASLSSKFEQRSITHWPTIFAGLGVTLTILASLGTAIYLPIQRDTSRLDVAVSAILDRGVFQRQYDADQVRNSQDRNQIRDMYGQTILARRYETDQARLTAALDQVEKTMELLRVRSFDAHGKVTGLDARVNEMTNRIDAISRRLAEFIRDMGKH